MNISWPCNFCYYNTLQTKILKKASTLLAEEKEQKKSDREQTLSERVPPLQLSGLTVQDLQVVILWPIVRMLLKLFFLTCHYSVYRICAKNSIKKLMLSMRNDMTLNLKFPKMKRRYSLLL